jgi:hypothetical protein
VGQELWSSLIISPDRLRFWLVAGMVAALVVGAIATVVPLRKGLRAFSRLEFA